MQRGIVLRKGNIQGSLQVVPDERRTSKGAYWGQCLTLVDGNGKMLTPCEKFRSNAIKKAVKHFTEQGWTVVP